MVFADSSDNCCMLLLDNYHPKNISPNDYLSATTAKMLTLSDNVRLNYAKNKG